MARNCKRNTCDSFLAQLSCTTVVSRSGSRTEEQLEPKSSRLHWAKEVPLRSILGSDEIHISQWKTAVRNEPCLEPLIRNKKLYYWCSRWCALAEPSTQTTKALRILPSELMVTVRQDFTRNSQDRVAQLLENDQNEVTIYSAAELDAWIGIVIQLFTDNKIRCKCSQELYAGHYRKNLHEAINQWLGIIRYKMCWTNSRARWAQIYRREWNYWAKD